MNRAQRRKQQKKSLSIKKSFSQMSHFSSVPLATMCQSILLLIQELQRRGYPIYDFDNKKKCIQGIHIIKGKVFFLAAEEVENCEKT